MLLRRIIFVSLLACLLSFQSLYGGELQVSADFQVGLPQGDFKHQLDRGGIGVGFMGGYRFGGSPVMFGLDMGFMNFGKDERVEPLSSTIPDLTVQVANEYNLFHGDLLLRLITPNPDASIRPYADGLFGFNHFFTQTVLRERNGFSSDDDVLRDTNFRDTSMRYGVGGGVQFRLIKTNVGEENGGSGFPMTIALNLMGRYIFGQEAEYLQEGSIHRENGEVFFDVSRSNTDMFYIKLGAMVSF